MPMMYSVREGCHSVSAEGIDFVADANGQIDLSGQPRELIRQLVDMAGCTPVHAAPGATPPPPIVDAPAVDAPPPPPIVDAPAVDAPPPPPPSVDQPLQLAPAGKGKLKPPPRAVEEKTA